MTVRPWSVGVLTAVLTSFLALLVLGFLTVLGYTTITPAREAVQDFAVCRGADRIDRQDTHSTQRRTTAGGYRDTGATTTDLTCHYGDEVRHVGNDAAFLRGGGYALGGAAATSAGVGILLGVLAALRRRRRLRART
ncbi:hypothetical protein RB608_09565 [Nocardioides sp. LHD-245]|uniref:hypothetical protein n=1 Tax=Nocardioides sp. LHD-245 TaxID=3051387 RepID=UPI0027DFE633|nr:hypothetical protein [Nocardioides sp. LHD-245]